MTEQEERERVTKIESLIEEYEEELGPILHTGKTFDVGRLPHLVQSAIKLVVAKSPAFSNVGALTTVNYVLNHVIGQMRPTINERVYSDDSLTPNYYGILISPSGSGKDSSYNALLKACKTATSMIEDTREEIIVNRAKERALKVKLREEPNATIEDLDYSEYQPFLKDKLNTIMSGESTRGGIASVLNKFQQEPLGIPSIFMGEFGLDLKNGTTIQELLKLLGTLYDMGISTPPEFKTDESKEAPISDMYPNFLGHTSPKVLFGDAKVKEALANLFHTMLARRCWFSMPSDEESIENSVIPEDIKESRKQAAERREILSIVSVEIDNAITEAVRTMLADPAKCVVTFDDATADMYTDYFEYCGYRAKLMPDSSIEQTEMSGRAFKVGRLASVWALASGQNEVTTDMLASSIYFAEYNARYIETFVKLTTSKPYILLAEHFIKSKTQEITLDAAITSGYVSRVSTDYRELIDPLNSYLRDKGVCKYDAEEKIFKYTPFKAASTSRNAGYTMSYTVVDGMDKDARSGMLDSFEKVKSNGSFKFLTKLMATDAIYNVFKYDTAPNKFGVDVPNNRNQRNIISDTRLVSIDIDESPVPLEIVHEYLEEFKHIICTTSDKNNRYKFRIVLPVNVALSGEDPKLYSYVVKRIASELLLKADPTSFNPAQPMYAYKDAEVLSTEDGLLFSITDYITEFATDAQVNDATSIKLKSKTPAERKRKVDKIMSNINQEFDYVISAPMGFGSWNMARASLHMLDSEFTVEEYVQVINYINSIWASPMSEERLKLTILDQFVPRFSEQQ